MAKLKGLTYKKIAEVYEKKACNVSATCAALNISRTMWYRWREKHPGLDELLKESEEGLIDFAETKLMENIQNGDVTSLIFFLKTKGKGRGYVETVKNEVTLNPFEELMKALPDNPE